MKRAFLLILVLMSFNVEAGTRRSFAPSSTCGFKAVSYRFVGNAGTTIVYGKKSFTIPSTGVIELVAQRDEETYKVGSRSFRVPQNATANEFGSVTVDLSHAADSSTLFQPGV